MAKAKTKGTKKVTNRVGGCYEMPGQDNCLGKILAGAHICEMCSSKQLYREEVAAKRELTAIAEITAISNENEQPERGLRQGPEFYRSQQ